MEQIEKRILQEVQTLGLWFPWRVQQKFSALQRIACSRRVKFMKFLFAGSILCGLLVPVARAGTLVEFVAPVGNYGTDPYYPMTGLTEGRDGAFYGTSSQGGTNNNQGTVFRVTVQGVRTTIVSFNKTNGASPQARLLRASDGNLYGTTYYGGVENNGTVFRISTNGVFTNLAYFSLSSSGVWPGGLWQRGQTGSFTAQLLSVGRITDGAPFLDSKPMVN
jgi:uncharacterized repeat protein (TIGR03803 family)